MYVVDQMGRMVMSHHRRMITAAPRAPTRLPRAVRMSDAEWITLREACGLTQAQAGAVVGAAHRTVQHWEGGRNGIPLAAANALRNLDDLIRQQATLALEPLARRARPTNDAVVLTRYRSEADYAGSAEALAGLPWAAHAALLWRVMDGLSRLRVPYTVGWAAPGAETATQAALPASED